jgi:hypothetical protein
MIPGPAPVMTMKPAAAINRANSTASRYSGWPGSVRAEPKIATLRVSLIRREKPEGVAQLPHRRADHPRVAAVLHIRQQLQRIDNDVLHQVGIGAPALERDQFLDALSQIRIAPAFLFFFHNLAHFTSSIKA